MKEAFRNLLLVTGLVCICVFGIWGFLRIQAAYQPVRPPLDHPFLKAASKDIVLYHSLNQHPTYDLAALKKAMISPSLVLWVDVRPAGPRPEDSKLVAAQDDTDLEGAPALADVLAAFPENRMILNFRANRPGMAESAAKDIENAKADARVLIQSPEDGFLKELREARPLWIYGSSLARVTQLEMLTSVGLEGVAPLKGDALVVELTRERETLRRNIDKLVEEGHRRQMKVYAGPFTNEEAIHYRSIGGDGVLVSDPAPLLNQATR